MVLEAGLSPRGVPSSLGTEPCPPGFPSHPVCLALLAAQKPSFSGEVQGAHASHALSKKQNLTS